MKPFANVLFQEQVEGENNPRAISYLATLMTYSCQTPRRNRKKFSPNKTLGRFNFPRPVLLPLVIRFRSSSMNQDKNVFPFFTISESLEFACFRKIFFFSSNDNSSSSRFPNCFCNSVSLYRYILETTFLKRIHCSVLRYIVPFRIIFRLCRSLFSLCIFFLFFLSFSFASK